MSHFNKEVNKRRNNTPWATMDLANFAREMAVQGSHADLELAKAEGMIKPNHHSGKNDFILIVQYRSDVTSKFWFVARWTGADGNRHFAEGQTMELCMWRAAQVELDLQKKMEEK